MTLDQGQLTPLRWAQPEPGASVTVTVPASSANLGPGFDSVGLALGVWDEASVTVTDEPGVVVEVQGEGVGAVPLDESHLVVRTLAATFAHLGLGVPPGLHLRCANAVPHGRGLGSSATAIVTGALAAVCLAAADAEGELTGTTREAALDVVNQVASALEGHPDNASASVYGGATISVMGPRAQGAPLTRTVRLPLHDEIDVVVCVPGAQLSTAHARSVLPQSVSLATAAQSTARGGLLTHALTTDPSLLLEATVDVLHQEQRRPSYPSSMSLLDGLRARGHAAVISGAGPSLLVLTTRGEVDVVREAVGELDDVRAWQVSAPGVPDVGATALTVVH
ncbi:homoserine kinase [Marihabitans asiaticum]|uniref:Homoserine kinase n=1 Tax=Marihabitans asiaticum TaxID=415218 RepID=A0A560W8E8_9MICO|nr:homoserine kinase [Marihabitans asiaticum]TWD13897.1 homoserine kinase [Marihabitans asiaticum]